MIFPYDVQEDPQSRFVHTQIAGLQFYDYDDEDEIVGKLRPMRGDRLQLIRQPENRYDPNAIEVWWRDGRVQLGHIPRFLAYDLAPLMDEGRHIRAYVDDGGDGRTWSVRALLVSDHIPDFLYEAALSDAAVEESIDQIEVDRLARADRWVSGWQARQEQRRIDAARTLALVIAEDEQRGPGDLPNKAPRSARGKVFGWWDQIPDDGEKGPVLRTKSQWSQAGYKIKPRVKKPYASICYYARGNRAEYGLFSADQVTPKKVQSLRARASTLARDIY